VQALLVGMVAAFNRLSDIEAQYRTRPTIFAKSMVLFFTSFLNRVGKKNLTERIGMPRLAYWIGR